MRRQHLSPSAVPTDHRAILLWRLSDAPTALLDRIFEEDREVRDHFLKDWSGEDVLVALAWELCLKSETLRLLENLLSRLTENGRQDVDWYALRPALLHDILYAVLYVNFDTALTPDAFTHLDGCPCAFCCRLRKLQGGADAGNICLTPSGVM